MRHTPGPWPTFVNTSARRVEINFNWMSDYCSDAEYAELEANARLASAAPEMLELLTSLRTEIIVQGEYGDQENLRLIENVIRKAKGE